MAFSSATKAGLMRLSQAQNPSTGNNSVMLSKRKIGGLGKIQAAANVGETESKPGHKISHSAAGLLSRREFIPGKGRARPQVQNQSALSRRGGPTLMM